MRPVLALATALGTVFAFGASAAHAQYTTYDEFGRPHVHHPSGLAPMQPMQPMQPMKPLGATDGGQMFKPYKPYEPPKPFTGVHVDADGPFTRGGTFAPQPKRPRRPGDPPGF